MSDTNSVNDIAAAASTGKKLEVLNCEGCGVCCFHMGYPAFVMPVKPKTVEQIEADPELSRQAKNSRIRQQLLTGRDGESHWHRLPQDLKIELLQTIDNYVAPNYDGSVESLDGPCVWLDMDTRRCRHHEYRPNVCRDFETGSSGCLDWRKTHRDQIEPAV